MMARENLIAILYASNEAMTEICREQNDLIRKQNEVLAQLGAVTEEEERAAFADRLERIEEETL